MNTNRKTAIIVGLLYIVGTVAGIASVVLTLPVVNRQGYTIHMWFYCLGGILWYYLSYKSRYVPRGIPLFGLTAVAVALVGIVLQLFSYAVPIFVYLPLLPFELTIGTWLVLKGRRDGSETKLHVAHATETI